MLLTVSFTTSGTFGHTVINVPGDSDPELEFSGVVSLGRGSDLRGDVTVVTTFLRNITPPVDALGVQYELNGKNFLEHKNLKTEESEPTVMLTIQFPSIS